MDGVRQIHCVVLSRWQNASWRRLNSPCALGKARAIDQSLPSIWCHFSREMQHWIGRLLQRMSLSHLWQCVGSIIVMMVVLTTQPSMVLVVCHDALLLSSFLMEIGSL